MWFIYCRVFQITFQQVNIDSIYVIFHPSRINISLNRANHSNFTESSIYTHLTWASKHEICCSYSRLSNPVSFLYPCSKHKIRSNSQNHHISYNRAGNILSHNQITQQEKTKNWEATHVFFKRNFSFRSLQFFFQNQAICTVIKL